MISSVSRKSKLVNSVVYIAFLVYFSCQNNYANRNQNPTGIDSDSVAVFPESPAVRDSSLLFVVKRDVKVKEYFAFMDSLVLLCDSLHDYPLTEHILVHANHFILDTLVSFDYYTQMSKGVFVEDQKELVVLHKGDTLIVPDSAQAVGIEQYLKRLTIDVNIPEFKLRILNADTVEYTFDVRVGKNQKKYLKNAGRRVSLRTPVGSGEIVRIAKDPWYINPVDGHRYSSTSRDDGRRTKLPQIPFLEPTIAGERKGSLIHPTTNPNTLGRASSNGCVGTREGEAWIVYYHAPLGTKVVFRYDLEVITAPGDTLYLNDIYGYDKISN